MNEHFKKRQSGTRMALPRLLAILCEEKLRSSHCSLGIELFFSSVFDLAERRNETGDAHQPGICKQLGHLGDTPDVLLAVLRGEAQVLVQAVTDVVSVQGVTWDGVGYEVLLQSKTDGSLPGTGQT